MENKKAKFEEYQEEFSLIIEKFLREEYFTSGDVINVDYTIFLNIRDMKIWEYVDASSNWYLSECDDDVISIFHLENYNKAFRDHTDLIAECSIYSIEENLSAKMRLPKKKYNNLSFEQQIQYWEKKAKKGIVYYNTQARNNVISEIISSIDWELIEEKFYEFSDEKNTSC